MKKGIVRIAFETQPLGTVKATSLTSADVERLRAEVRDVIGALMASGYVDVDLTLRALIETYEHESCAHDTGTTEHI